MIRYEKKLYLSLTLYISFFNYILLLFDMKKGTITFPCSI